MQIKFLQNGKGVVVFNQVEMWQILDDLAGRSDTATGCELAEAFGRYIMEQRKREREQGGNDEHA